MQKDQEQRANLVISGTEEWMRAIDLIGLKTNRTRTQVVSEAISFYAKVEGYCIPPRLGIQRGVRGYRVRRNVQ